MKYLLSIALFVTSLFFLPLQAQDDLMDLLEEMEEETTDYTYATFKSVRLVNAHTIETAAGGVLQMIISHRFGRLNGGAYELWGLDQANIRIGLEYGITDWLNVGVGRSNVGKTYDGFLKVKMLRQSTGKRKMPITATWYSSTAINSLRWADPSRENYFSSRMAFTYQLMIARKFGERFSMQVMPTMVHRNLVETGEDENDVLSVGAGGRFKLTPGVSLNAEYFYLLPGTTADQFSNSFSMGFDIETGGHVFQLIFTNSLGMTENLFIPGTTGEWGDGDVHFGFNISRVFTVSKKNRKVKKGEGW